MPTLRGILQCRSHEANRGSAMTTPNFEDFQKFSKQQLDAVSAATATVAKGLVYCPSGENRIYFTGRQGAVAPYMPNLYGA